MKNVFNPFSRQGTNGSMPDALDTMALSTIEIAGAVYKKISGDLIRNASV